MTCYIFFSKQVMYCIYFSKITKHIIFPQVSPPQALPQQDLRRRLHSSRFTAAGFTAAGLPPQTS